MVRLLLCLAPLDCLLLCLAPLDCLLLCLACLPRCLACLPRCLAYLPRCLAYLPRCLAPHLHQRIDEVIDRFMFFRLASHPNEGFEKVVNGFRFLSHAAPWTSTNLRL